jgi:hypothetical protein
MRDTLALPICLLLGLLVLGSSTGLAAPRKPHGDDKLLKLVKEWAPDFASFQERANLNPIWRSAPLCERFDVHLDRGELVFSDGGVPKIVARAELIGTYSQSKRRWRWGWAHAEVPASASKALDPVRAFGEAQGIEFLTRAFGPAAFGDGEWTGWAMMVIAAKLVPAMGVYQVPTPDGKVYLLITSVDRPAGNPDASCSGNKTPLTIPIH